MMQLRSHGFRLEVFRRIDARQHPRSGMDRPAKPARARLSLVRLYAIYAVRTKTDVASARRTRFRLPLFPPSHALTEAGFKEKRCRVALTKLHPVRLHSLVSL